MKSLTIALATAKEAIRQPAFFVMAFFAGALLIVTIFVPYFTFGEDIKMYKDTGLTTISFFCMLLALLTASSTVADEIEGKTAITLLSKPINRRQFIVGKFLGIELGVLALYVLLGAAVRGGRLVQVRLRLARIGRRRGRIGEAVGAGDAGHAGAGARLLRGDGSHGISVAISTRLPMLANLVVCILIFFLGHLSPVLVELAEQGRSTSWSASWPSSSRGSFPRSSFSTPAHRSQPVRSFPGWLRFAGFGYCVLYSGAALLFAFLLFEDRDLA